MSKALPSYKDSLGRRSRFRRQPSGKQIVLTDRDFEIFQLLWRYRYLRSDRIVAYIAPRSQKRLIERLGDLFHETQHLNRPSAQWQRAKSEHVPQAYELTKTGLSAFAENYPKLQLPEPMVNFGGAVNRQILQFEHALQISETLFDIEHSIIDSQDKRFVVETEIRAKASAKLSRNIEHISFDVTIPKSPNAPMQRKHLQTRIVPDALFGIEHYSAEGPTYRFYALEVERSNPIRRRSLEKPSALKKLLAYQSLLRSNSIRQQLSLPNLFLVIAASTPEKLLAIMTIADETWSVEEQKFLLFVPPTDLRTLSKSDTNTTVQFETISSKWSEHFGR